MTTANGGQLVVSGWVVSEANCLALLASADVRRAERIVLARTWFRERRRLQRLRRKLKVLYTTPGLWEPCPPGFFTPPNAGPEVITLDSD